MVLVAAFVVGRGASELARQRRAIAVVNDELAEATAAKSRFLASMSHDLRTPLNAIIGFSEVLESELFGTLNEKQKEYLGDIVSSGKLQLQLVNEILDLSKIEAGKMELAPEDFDLADALRGVHSVVGALAVKKAQHLSLDVGDMPPMHQDPIRVKQIVFNLLGNAVKFTPEGGHIATRAHADRDGHVEIVVSDSGVGIAADEMPKLFQSFERVGTGYSRGQQGSGLGLSLVKRFAEMMGGSVTVASAVGQGSTFTVRLPMRAPAAQ
jgi:signal transduction histidine kinase